MSEPNTPGPVDRRHVMAGGLAAVGLLGLAACGDGSTGSADGAADAGGATTTTPTTSAESSTSTTATGAPAAAIVALADVPVGGAVSAKAADGAPLIVAQPTAGKAVAFSAVCTHMRCTVAPEGNQIKCPCHGSIYATADGSNVSGPAPSPLAKVEVQVVDGQVVPA